MKRPCPKCGKLDNKTIDTRWRSLQELVVRKHHCEGCGWEWRSVEVDVPDDCKSVEIIPSNAYKTMVETINKMTTLGNAFNRQHLLRRK
jgi:transcriptional regulator NrdR family protein